MISLYFVLTAIFVVGLFIVTGIKDAAKSMTKPRSAFSYKREEPKEIRMPEDEHSLCLRKRYLEETKESYYKRGESRKWEEAMADVDAKLKALR